MSNDINQTAKFFKTVGIFSLLSLKEIKSIVNNFTLTSWEKGTVLFKEGDPGETLYIVKSGKVKILLDMHDGTQKVLAHIMPGDFLGEMSIFDLCPRSATCFIEEKSELFSMQGADFFSILTSHPQIAIKIMYKMLNTTTIRLQRTNVFLSDMVTWGENARKRAITDELTGLYNRRFMEDILAEQFQKAKNGNYPFSLVMIDMDHFRDINNKYNFKMGDQAILAVVDVFKNVLSDKDIVCRYGGDEFTMILPYTTSKQAYDICEELRNQVEASTLLPDIGEYDIKLSLSMGVACYPEHTDELKHLKELSDQALYLAKENGRNQVRINQ